MHHHTTKVSIKHACFSWELWKTLEKIQHLRYSSLLLDYMWRMMINFKRAAEDENLQKIFQSKKLCAKRVKINTLAQQYSNFSFRKLPIFKIQLKVKKVTSNFFERWDCHLQFQWIFWNSSLETDRNHCTPNQITSRTLIIV